MNAETTTTTRAPAAVPGRCLPAGELNRATDVLLDAAAERSDPATAAVRATVAEFADWCAVDVLGSGVDARARGERQPPRTSTRTTSPRAISRFEVPDMSMLARLELARSPIRVEDPVWLPRHRAVAAAIDGGAGVRGSIVALIPLDEHDLTGDLWFMGALGHRLAQVQGLAGRPHKLGGTVVAEPGGMNGHSREARLRRA